MTLKSIIKSIFKSYSIIFFSDSIVFSVIIIAVSFLDVFAGICGHISVVISTLTADLLGFDRLKTEKGYYGFNSLLIGIIMGITMDYNWTSVLLVCIASVMTFFATIFFEGVFTKYSLPYLSLPFLVVFWIINLAIRDVPLFSLSARDLPFVNYIYALSGDNLYYFYSWFSGFYISDFFRKYFLSLGSIFFQHKILSGMLIATGLLYYSRIAFSLSLLGFLTAYIFYPLVGLKVDAMLFSFFGFNYILVAIAIGGYFMIPSKASYLWTILLMPVTVIITIATIKIFTVFSLMVYSLPFVLVVIVFLLVMRLRIYHSGKLNEVFLQTNSPEENLYNFINNNHRYKDKVYFSMRLPFYGEWTVSQAHNGEFTHKDKWSYAFDFVIRNNNLSTYKNYGTHLDDYYCYNKLILSPADGTIEEIIDGIADNSIGEINTENNWGNTIIIKHGENFFSQMSHLKPGSFKVNKGDYVKAGQPVAACGNSGRSPQPHLHFQFQAIPVIGADTLDYPFGYYLKKTNGNIKFISYKKPEVNDKIMNLEINSLVKKAMNFSHGDEINFEVAGKNGVKWKVITNIYNESYIHCEKTDSYAYFYKDDRMFYFYGFKGNRKSLLYSFFLAAYKIPLGYYQSVEIYDTFSLHYTFSKISLFIQDFIAPFYIFMESNYCLKYKYRDDELITNYIELESSIDKKMFGIKTGGKKFSFLIDKNGLRNFKTIKNNQSIIYECGNKN